MELRPDIWELLSTSGVKVYLRSQSLGSRTNENTNGVIQQVPKKELHLAQYINIIGIWFAAQLNNKGKEKDYRSSKTPKKRIIVKRELFALTD